MSILKISKVTRQRFVLSKQGLYPGRRWQGIEGVDQAIRSGCIVQMDPLNVVAHSHDIVLYGRVLDYQPAYLDILLYKDRSVFDYGGAVTIHPMEELPYWRVVMARKQREQRRVLFATEHADFVRSVYELIQERGPLSAHDFENTMGTQKSTFRSGKLANQVLYYLWIAGEIMTCERKGLTRVYDLRERIVPASLNYVVSDEEADKFFEHKIFQELGIMTARSWRNWFAGAIERKVEVAEASARLDALLSQGKIVQVELIGESGMAYFVLAEDLPLLEKLHAGLIPDEWQPLDASTSDEVIFLAPLEIVSARGRAKVLFGFEYLWEVYKPQEKRRWGYYTLPILYQDTLVARVDLKFERGAKILVIKGFWLEDTVPLDDRFVAALTCGFKRFMQFVGAETLDKTAIISSEILRSLDKI